MARMIPNIDPVEIDNLGEQLMYESLRDQLPKDWVVRYHYPMCVMRGGCLRECEADFVVVAPDKGLMFVETKSSLGWECREGRWFRLEKSGALEPTKNPFFQASRTKHSIRERLAKCLGLLEDEEFPGTCGHLVAYPRARVVGSLPASQDPVIVIAHRDMNELKKRFEAAFVAWGAQTAATPSRQRGFPPDVMQRVVAILCDDCRFVLAEGADLDAGNQAINQLTKRQFEFFKDVLGIRRLLVRGVAGSGKTMLAQLSADMASRRNKRVLLLCYNNLLAAWLRLTAGPDARYDVFSFFSLGSDLCRKAKVGFRVPSDPGEQSVFWSSTAPIKMMTAIDSLGDAARYDAILVDEAQDFQQDWWAPVELLLLSKESSLCALGDPDQRLYDIPEAYPADLAENVLEL